jgi:hypothetical protein
MKSPFFLILILLFCQISGCTVNVKETISDLEKFEDKNRGFSIYLPKGWKYFSSSDILASAIDTSSTDEPKAGIVLSELEYKYSIDSILDLNIEDLKRNYDNFEIIKDSILVLESNAKYSLKLFQVKYSYDSIRIKSFVCFYFNSSNPLKCYLLTFACNENSFDKYYLIIDEIISKISFS